MAGRDPQEASSSGLSSLDGLKLDEIEARLKRFGPIGTGNRADKLQRLKDFEARERDFPRHVPFDCGNLREMLEERRKVFDVPDRTWQHVDSLKASGIPRLFDMDQITGYLKDCLVNVGGVAVDCSTGAPSVKGRKLYKSRMVITCNHLKTDTMLLLKGFCWCSMTSEQR